jgi:hypothetical protein
MRVRNLSMPISVLLPTHVFLPSMIVSKAVEFSAMAAENRSRRPSLSFSDSFTDSGRITVTDSSR